MVTVPLQCIPNHLALYITPDEVQVLLCNTYVISQGDFLCTLTDSLPAPLVANIPRSPVSLCDLRLPQSSPTQVRLALAVWKRHRRHRGAGADMLRLAQVVLLCLFVRGGTGELQDVYPSFCPSTGLVGAQCDDSMAPVTPPQNTLVSQVMHLRCQSGCLMDVSWTGTSQHARPLPACSPPGRLAWEATKRYCHCTYVRTCVHCSYRRIAFMMTLCVAECVFGRRVGVVGSVRVAQSLCVEVVL